MRIRVSVAKRLTVRELAALLRSRLAEHIEGTKKAAELASLLRCLRGLPVWLFPEWEKEETRQRLEGLIAKDEKSQQLARTA